MNDFIYDTITSQFLPFNLMEVKSVWYVRIEGCLEKVILSFENESLVIEAESEDDSIRLFRAVTSQIGNLFEIAEPAPEIWSKYIGQRFGWGWITINQQNYLDGIMLSFNNIVPNLLLNVMGSSLFIFELEEFKKRGKN